MPSPPSPHQYRRRRSGQHHLNSLYPVHNGILIMTEGISTHIADSIEKLDIELAAKKIIIKYIGAREIFSSWTHKTEHFERIQRTRIPYTDILFFDDEDRNIKAVKNMGVTSILVKNGVNQQAFRQGLLEFSQKSSASSKAGPSGKNK